MFSELSDCFRSKGIEIRIEIVLMVISLHPLQLPCEFLYKAADEPEPRVLLKDKTDETALDELQCSGHWVSPFPDIWQGSLAPLELGFAGVANLDAAYEVVLYLVMAWNPR